MPEAIPGPIVLYDGVCALCNLTVRLLLRADRGRLLWFAPLQGQTAEALAAQGRAIPRDASTVVYVAGGEVHLRSRALLAIAGLLPYPWRALTWLRWLPAWLADPPYRVVARWRYRIFGRHDVCPTPPAEHRARFLP